MKKIVLTTIALSALLVGMDCSAKGNHELNTACMEECSALGKRVDFKLSAQEDACKCSTGQLAT